MTGGQIEVALGFRLRNASYRSVIEASAGEEISELTASRDLKRMVDAGLLTPVGERRGRYYLGPDMLRRIQAEVRAGRPPRAEFDPFALAQEQLQLTFET